jgi:protein FRA10AC1
MHKSALVKVVLCARCQRKLMWKHQKDKEEREKRVRELGKPEDEVAQEKDDQNDEVEALDSGLDVDEVETLQLHSGIERRRVLGTDGFKVEGGVQRTPHRKRDRDRDRDGIDGHRRMPSSRSRSPPRRNSVDQNFSRQARKVRPL